MKSATKAVLLSAFLFPGAGHLYLKRYVSGTLLIGATMVCVYFLVVRIIDTAQRISEMILSGAVRADVASITEALARQSAGADASLTSWAGWAIVVCFVVAAGDSYRLGHARDLVAEKTVLADG